MGTVFGDAMNDVHTTLSATYVTKWDMFFYLMTLALFMYLGVLLYKSFNER